MINVGEVYAWKFDDQARWEEVALNMGYIVTKDVVKSKGKEIVSLIAKTKDGDNRGMYFCWMNDRGDPIKGFLSDKPQCGCGHSHG